MQTPRFNLNPIPSEEKPIEARILTEEEMIAQRIKENLEEAKQYFG